MIAISKSARRGFKRATEVLIENRVWPDYENGRHVDYYAIKGDWKKVGAYIKSGEEKYRVKEPQ